MSTYEDYGRASLDYDASRVAVGAEIVLGAAVVAGIDLAIADVLDAGCGTGSYAAAVRPHVGSLTLVDADEGMLAQAEAKLSTVASTVPVRLHRALLPDLPFADGSFDLVMVNQVLHHLGDEEGDGGGWKAHGEALVALARSVRAGGMLVVNTCSQRQLRDAYWYYALIPAAADALRRRYAPVDDLEAAMLAAGLSPTGRFVPNGQLLQGASYLDGRSPLDPAWRQGDSAWSLATAEQLAGAVAEVEALDHDGSLEAFVTTHDEQRAALGQITFVTARRP